MHPFVAMVAEIMADSMVCPEPLCLELLHQLASESVLPDADGGSADTAPSVAALGHIALEDLAFNLATVKAAVRICLADTALLASTP